MSLDEYNRLTQTDDPWCPAWNVDMPWLLLWIFSVWKDTKLWRLPIRRAPDDFAFAETIRRLSFMGLLEHGATDKETCHTTERGLAVLDCIRWCKPIQELDVHSAYLLAVAYSGSVSTNVSRVLTRMAFISAVGIKNFCEI
ncbi:hypothetical protein F5Y00DRAFT_244313 [Daldinia vernicosa]|uniref:uncharacterized protein n=1 Tax=Daldinia vernicosa TaxID=114800 RepID=UPI002008415C|nr:uncharacterized protein F5Y00DRAFT_244313 [Daldinia vernicosa]KAI0846197.1 hypothetical protein F5Y00DRAFT_244313 [Daldinia vernicosa]